jgi:hypothetical protein
VLAIWTWDGEASVVLTRWKRGKQRAKLTLLNDAFRGSDGIPRAPAKVLWPWLPREQREAVLGDGVRLVEPSAAASTGDEELDALLEDFDEADRVDVDAGASDGAIVYVPLETSVAALGAAVGIVQPFLDPLSLGEGDQELLFRPMSPHRPADMRRSLAH